MARLSGLSPFAVSSPTLMHGLTLALTLPTPTPPSGTPSRRPYSSSPSSPEYTRATDGLSAAVDCPRLSSLADSIHLRRTRRTRPVSPAAYISPYQSHTSRPTRPIHPAAYTPSALPLAFHFPSTYLPLPTST
ncbi:hypothetical protein GGF50DRAFT_121316 [Schizophyllum commune]